VHAGSRPYLKTLTFKVSPAEVVPSIIAKTALVMRERLRAAHISGTVASTRRGYLRVTLDTTLPKAYTLRLLTQTGYVTLKTIQSGSLYRSRSSRPIRSAVLESPEYAAAHSGIISSAPVVIFTLSDPSAFAEFTGAHIGQDLGIYLDDRLISAPRLTGPISNSGAISGGAGGTDSVQELAFIAAVMNSGPLPAHVAFVSSSAITPG
jgi:preprotein translocase subunit SecD